MGATQTRSQTSPPEEPGADRQVEGDTRDWEMNPMHRNLYFGRQTHLTNQSCCLSRSPPSPLLGGELEAVVEQRTENMGFLEHENEAPMAEMEENHLCGL